MCWFAEKCSLGVLGQIGSSSPAECTVKVKSSIVTEDRIETRTSKCIRQKRSVFICRCIRSSGIHWIEAFFSSGL